MSVSNISSIATEDALASLKGACSSPTILTKVKAAASNFFNGVPAAVTGTCSSVKKMTASLASACPSRPTVVKVGLSALALGASAYLANKFCAPFHSLVARIYK
jgi:hypothetical protein